MPSSDYYSNIQRLKRFLFNTEEYGYVFAVTSDYRLMSEVNTFLLEESKLKLKKLGIVNITCNYEFI